jgi:hypothetical protein
MPLIVPPVAGPAAESWVFNGVEWNDYTTFRIRGVRPRHRREALAVGLGRRLRRFPYRSRRRTGHTLDVHGAHPSAVPSSGER